VTTYDAILPAGGSIDPAFAARVGTESKALIPFAGRTILRRTVDALQETGRVHRTVLVGTPEVLAHPDAKLADDHVPAGTSGPDTIFRGLKHLTSQPNPPEKILIVTADLPFLTADVFHRFLAECPDDRGICVPLVTKREYQARFPGSDATFIPLRDDAWTAGCAYVMDVAAFNRALPHLEQLFQVRKSKVGMVRMLGLGFLVKFLTKTLTLADVERKITDVLQCSGKGVLGAPPEFAYDVDYLDDYEYALQHFSEGHGQS
jgi:molybdopterin-guanine dinucleotide biosynthesis protein A